ncbi:hypothetical protein LXA43DRAFT_1097246 [Ganoderma leucocontextum]|nr:hypothetical protein LXA43DRAFT_1097246 [Ganoderma leucocontextum]
MAPQGNKLPSGILPLDQCILTVEGTASVVYHLHVLPLLVNEPESCLRVMAIVFLTFNGTNDGRHSFSASGLHSTYHPDLDNQHPNWRTHIRTPYIMMQLIMDSLTHGSGTDHPKTEQTPEEAKLRVFLPIVLLHEYSTLAPVFASSVQSFAEHVATIARDRWDRPQSRHDGGAPDDPKAPQTSSRRWVEQGLILSSSTSQPSHSSLPISSQTLYMSLPGQSHIKLAYSVYDPGRTEDVLEWANMTKHHLFEALRSRIDVLETAVHARDAEIGRLREPLGDDGNDTEHEASPTRLTVTDRTIAVPSDALGSGKGKTVARRARSTPRSSLSPPSAVSSAPLSPSSDDDHLRRAPTYYPASSWCFSRHGRYQADSRRPAIFEQVSSFAGGVELIALLAVEYVHVAPGQRDGQHVVVSKHVVPMHALPLVFRPLLNHVIQYHDLPQSTHAILRRIESTYPTIDWRQGVLTEVPKCSLHLGEQLVKAMYDDCDESP